MLLATKCPHCQTTFKVANDQLKLQSGLVRCGICHQVFNGIEHLAQADASATTRKIQPSEPATDQVIAAPAPSMVSAPAAAENSKASIDTGHDLFDSFGISTDEAPRIEPALDLPQLADTFFPNEPSVENPAARMNELPMPEEQLEEIVLTAPQEVAEIEAALPQNRHEPLLDPLFDEVVELEENEEVDSNKPVETETSGADEELTQLLFIRQAKTRKRWRWVLIIGTLLLILSLAGQALWQFHDYLAAAYPQTRASLITLCRIAHCQIGLPAQLDAISYEADELHSLPHQNTFEFSLLMRNHSALVQAWPSIELTLKDPKKQVVLRRVFMPSEYLASPREELAGFQGGQEQAVKLYFVVDKVTATDYIVSIFYP